MLCELFVINRLSIDNVAVNDYRSIAVLFLQQCLGMIGADAGANGTVVIEMTDRATFATTPPTSPRALLPPTTPLSTTSTIFTITKAPERTVVSSVV